MPKKNEIKVLNKGFVRLVDHMGNDSSIVQAARVSYGKGTKKISEDEGLIRYLMRHRHTTPFEMGVFKFHVKAPIFIFRQWHRHRTWSFNEISGRYSEMKDEYYIPEENKVTFQNPTNKQGGTSEMITPLNIKNPDDWWDCLTPKQMMEGWSWNKEFEEDQSLVRSKYERYLGSGMRKELARINLPLAQYSEMYAKVDLHNLFHFLKLRLDSHAQYEIRVYAQAMFDLIKPIVPRACQAFEDYQLNSINLTKYDIQALQEEISCGMASDNKTIAALFPTKREYTEYLTKRDKFIETDE